MRTFPPIQYGVPRAETEGKDQGLETYGNRPSPTLEMRDIQNLNEVLAPVEIGNSARRNGYRVKASTSPIRHVPTRTRGWSDLPPSIGDDPGGRRTDQISRLTAVAFHLRFVQRRHQHRMEQDLTDPLLPLAPS
ncbi:hypothetical protein EDB87DRAFT_1688213 [Lactarius vividus]|nr:hypothetical protein EDB87DRAFT_1688213 [Lactarius vividus]